MGQRNTVWLIFIAVLVLAAIWVVAAGTIPGTNVNFTVHEGLDLQGGLQALLEADVPDCGAVEAVKMDAAKRIVELRVNGLGVTEPVVQKQGTCRIVVELPGVTNPQQAVDSLKQTALLEFVPMGTEHPGPGTIIVTDCKDPAQVDCGNPTDATAAYTGPVATMVVTNTNALTATTAPTTSVQVYHTLMTGAGLTKAAPALNAAGQWVIEFTLADAGKKIFQDYTASHVGEALTIVLDKKVLSAPNIESEIRDQGTITGNFTQVSATELAQNLEYGSLPVPLKIARYQSISPTLGQDSVRRSLVAGIIGLSTVVLFMLLYYRLPGGVASLALLIYAVFTIALYKMIPVTLTLPGIAGFVLSVGVAVDANILIFERMKEELRAGKTLINAVEAGFRRAWPSIRDSNISTLITCLILYIFGSTVGASIVKGFALTLALGVLMSLFTAILVTRSILHLFLDRIDFSTKHSWFGI